MTTAASWRSCRRRPTRPTRTPGSPPSKTSSAGDDYANIELVDTVYGNDESEESYNQALALVDQYPDLELIMAPTTVGIAAAAKAMQDEGLCDQIKVSGLGLPAEMREFTESGCAPEFALWSFVDLGYLTYYVTYGIATGQIEAAEGATFDAGRMGTYTIEKDPTRDAGLRVLMGPFSVYNADNIGESAAPATTAAGGAAPATTAAGDEAAAPRPLPTRHRLHSGADAPVAQRSAPLGAAAVSGHRHRPVGAEQERRQVGGEVGERQHVGVQVDAERVDHERAGASIRAHASG